MELLSTLEGKGVLTSFTLSLKDVQEMIAQGLQDEKGGSGANSGEVDGGGWDMVEGGEEVIRGDGWLKLNSFGHPMVDSTKLSNGN
jgi:hypothetical protein